MSASKRSATMALVAAFLGWMFDGFEMGLFPLIGKPALMDLLPKATELERTTWFTVIIAVFLVGAATGGVLFGWLGDKLGRVKAMTLAIFTYAVFTGCLAFVTDAWQLAALRFIASLGMGGEWSLGVALVNELWAGRNRAWIAGMIGAASNIGFMLVGVLSLTLNSFLNEATQTLQSIGLSQGVADYLLHNRAWRLLSISGALPALINFFILIFVHESHQWQEEKKTGHTSNWVPGDLIGVLIAAIASLAIIYVWSPMFSELPFAVGTWGAIRVGTYVAWGVTIVGLVVALIGYLHPVRRYMVRALASGSMDAKHRVSVNRNLLLGAALAGIALLGTWGSAQQAPRWAASLVENMATSAHPYPILDYTQIATAIGAIIVTLITPFVADKLGRRLTYSLLCFLAYAASIAFFKGNHLFSSEAVPRWFFVSAFLIGGLTASFYGFFPLYFPELFPTSVRATGQGFCFNFGRLLAAIGALQLGNIVSLFPKSSLPHVTSANAYCVLSSLYVIGMVLVWFCPETKGKALE
ncbi:MAG TPA: MFS transporter [Verrucomicrobiaceae bacterium]|jgi:MFS family permease